jgi:hypothetical protein
MVFHLAAGKAIKLMAPTASSVSIGSVRICLGEAMRGPVFAPVFAIFYGAGNGILTIARGTLPLALFGSHGFRRSLNAGFEHGSVAYHADLRF